MVRTKCNIRRHELTAYGNVNHINGSYFASVTGQVHSWNGRMAYNKISKVQCKEKFLTRLVLLFADLAVLMILKFMLLCGYKNMAVNNIYAFQSKYVDFIIYTLSWQCSYIPLQYVTVSSRATDI